VTQTCCGNPTCSPGLPQFSQFTNQVFCVVLLPRVDVKVPERWLGVVDPLAPGLNKFSLTVVNTPFLSLPKSL